LYSSCLAAFALDDSLDEGLVSILDAKYEVVAPDEVAAKQKHLNRKQRRDLAALLKRYPKLFSGQLGHYPHRKMHIELKDDAVPVHMRPYAVPRNLQEVFKKELDHLESLGVLERVGGSEWAAPTFIVPKKDGRVRWVSDFRALNRVIKRKVYPLPRIQDIIAKRSGYQFSPSLIFQCNTTPLSSLTKPRISAPSSLHSTNIAIFAYQWESSNHLTSPKKSWKTSSAMSKNATRISTTLAASIPLRNPIFTRLNEFSLVFKTTVLP
jgi:hypothetical protein